jgi:hypothetical protein
MFDVQCSMFKVRISLLLRRLRQQILASTKERRRAEKKKLKLQHRADAHFVFQLFSFYLTLPPVVASAALDEKPNE